MNNQPVLPAPDMRHAAVCGLFCPSCLNFIDTKENSEERLGERAKLFNRPIEDIKCHGCRSDVLFFYCRENCVMKDCAAQKGVDFCGECTEYPCAILKEFQSQLPHRIELWQSQERIKEVGYEQWYMEMIERYSCPQCTALNSAYDLKCRDCGTDPSCEYVNKYKDQIVQAIKDMDT